MAICAAVLAFGPAAPAAAGTGSEYGYVMTGSTYTSSSATWTMGAAHCSAGGGDTYLSMWTGLDGYSSDSAEQVGTDADCAGKTPEYYGWYEMYPAASVTFSNAISAGDSLTASVTFTAPSSYTLKLADNTKGWTQTVKKTETGLKRSSAETVVQTTSNITCTTSYTIAAFTGVKVDGAAMVDPVEVTGSDPHIAVTPLSGSAFTVFCSP